MYGEKKRGVTIILCGLFVASALIVSLNEGFCNDPPENQPPYNPRTPNGADCGQVGLRYTFTTYGIDPDGDRVSYMFMWDDDTFSYTHMVSSGGYAGKSHIWDSPGEYRVRAKTIDENNAQSDWSPVFMVTISDHNNINENESKINHIPTKTIITGPIFGKVGEEYQYTFVANDPDGDRLSYLIHWGEGDTYDSEMVGPYSPNEVVVIKNMWDTPGKYFITAYAVDLYKAEGDLETFEVNIMRPLPYVLEILFEMISNII
jgi:hypothetical protein